MLDNLDLFDRRDRELLRWLKSRPICVDCGEPIQSEYLFDINGEPICPECLMSNYRRETEDYIG